MVEDGALLIENEIVSAINPSSGNQANPIDMQGQLVMPGMIDPRSDTIEKDLEPRPKVKSPIESTLLQTDRRFGWNYRGQ